MPAGLEHCGGLDFDRKIYEDLKNRCSPQLRNILDTRDDKAMRSRFMIAEWCQDIKHQLSEAKEAEILIPIGDMENYSLTREAFNVMIEPMVMEAIHLCESLVKKSGLGWGKVGRILLVGGSCRIPHIQDLLTTHTGRPLSLVDDPEFAVCQGAALHGLNFQKQTVKASEKTSSPGTNKNKPISKPEPVEKAKEPVSASETGDVVSATDLSSQSSLERPGETIILDYKILSEVIIKLLGRYNINSVPLFISPAIPPGKLINSRQSCKIPKSEEILGLIDCTFFGSAKNALVFGEKGIYFHSIVVETIPHKDTPETKINEVADSLKYDRFPESTFEAVGVYLHLDGRPKFNWEKVGGDWVVAILDDIRKIVLRLDQKEGGLADDGRVGAAKNSEPLFRSIVLDILKESKAQSLYSSPGIPPKKITNATKSCMVPENEKIIGIIDCTFWGSATDAMVFGEKGIYFHSDVIEIQGEEEIRVSVPMTGKLDYNDFPSEKFLIKDDHIEFNNKLRFYKCYIDIEPLVQTLKKIKRQIKIIYKEKQQSVTGTLQQVVSSKKGG